MKSRLNNSVLLLIILAISGAGLAQSGSNDNPANQVKIRVVSLALEDLSTTQLVIDVGLVVNSNRNVTVDQLVLSGLRVNGVPIYAAPFKRRFKRRFKLRRDAAVTLPEPLRITVYLRDLNSLQPLRKAISDGHATLDGIALLHVPLNPLARLMLLSNHAEVTTALHQQVPFTVPGGPLAATSLVTILDVTGAAFKALDSTINEVTKLGFR